MTMDGITLSGKSYLSGDSRGVVGMPVGMINLPNYHNSIYEALCSTYKKQELQKKPKAMKFQNGQ